MRRLGRRAGAAGTLLRRYIHGPGIDGEAGPWPRWGRVSPPNRVMCDGTAGVCGGKRYYHADWQGSVVAMSAASGALLESYSYSAFGEVVDASGNPFRYTGRRIDPETGLYYYRARYYAPAIGRFLQTDPVGYADGLHLYAYVGNDPVNGTDPSGEFANFALGALIGGGIQTTREIRNGSFDRGITSKEGLKAVGRILVSTAVGSITAGTGALATRSVIGLGLKAAARTVATNAAKNAVIGSAAATSGQITNNVIGATIDDGGEGLVQKFSDGSITEGTVEVAIGGAIFAAAGSVSGDAIAAGFGASNVFGASGTLSSTGSAVAVTIGNTVGNLSASDLPDPPNIPLPDPALCDRHPGAC